MPQVSMTLNSRTYRLSCGEGEQQRLAELANYVKQKVDKLVQDFGQVGEERLLLMAALLIADELWELREGKLPTPPPGQDRSGVERPPVASGQ